MTDSADHDTLVTEFCGLTGAPPQQALEYLTLTNFDLASAVSEYYTSQEEEDMAGSGSGSGAEPENQVPEGYNGPRTLDGRPAPQSTSAIPTVGSSSSSARQPPRRGIATLGSLGQSSSGHGHDHDDDDDTDDEDYTPDENPRDLFAGGEKSGLAVQDPARRDPRSLVNDIIKKAQANSKKPPGSGEPSQPQRGGGSRFHGPGMTLGGDDAPSIPVPDPTASSSGRSSSSRTEVQVRVLHLWTDGFSIEDGPLHRFDDPQNAADLAVIRSGRAPIHLMNVQPDQPVDVHINKHDENYRPPPKVYKPFGGSGHRLGSPTPGDGSPSRSAAAVTTPAAAQTTAAAESTPDVDLDPEQPILTIRLQLANGTRLPARFNASHTIGDVYGFVERAFPGSSDRPWVLATTFPNKDHTDRALALGEVPEFRKGGTAVMKWV